MKNRKTMVILTVIFVIVFHNVVYAANVPLFGSLSRGYAIIIHTEDQSYKSGSVDNDNSFDLLGFCDNDFSKLDKKVESSGSSGFWDDFKDIINTNELDILETNGAHYLRHGLYAINGICFNANADYAEVGHLPEEVSRVPAYYKGYYFYISIIKESYEISIPITDMMDPFSYVNGKVEGDGYQEMKDTVASFYQFSLTISTIGLFFSFIYTGIVISLQGHKKPVLEELFTAIISKIGVYLFLILIISLMGIFGEIINIFRNIK